MQLRRSLAVAAMGAALALTGGPAWADEPEPLPDGCSYVEEPAPDDSTGSGSIDPEPATEETPSGEPVPEPSGTEEPPLDEPTDLPTAEPTSDPSGEPVTGGGEVVVCVAEAQAGEGFTGGGGSIAGPVTPGQAPTALPTTGSGTGSAALLGLTLLVAGTAVVLAARAPRRT